MEDFKTDSNKFDINLVHFDTSNELHVPQVDDDTYVSMDTQSSSNLELNSVSEQKSDQECDISEFLVFNSEVTVTDIKSASENSGTVICPNTTCEELGSNVPIIVQDNDCTSKNINCENGSYKKNCIVSEQNEQIYSGGHSDMINTENETNISSRWQDSKAITLNSEIPRNSLLNDIFKKTVLLDIEKISNKPLQHDCEDGNSKDSLIGEVFDEIIVTEEVSANNSAQCSVFEDSRDVCSITKEESLDGELFLALKELNKAKEELAKTKKELEDAKREKVIPAEQTGVQRKANRLRRRVVQRKKKRRKKLPCRKENPDMCENMENQSSVVQKEDNNLSVYDGKQGVELCSALNVGTERRKRFKERTKGKRLSICEKSKLKRNSRGDDKPIQYNYTDEDFDETNRKKKVASVVDSSLIVDGNTCETVYDHSSTTFDADFSSNHNTDKSFTHVKSNAVENDEVLVLPHGAIINFSSNEKDHHNSGSNSLIKSRKKSESFENKMIDISNQEIPIINEPYMSQAENFILNPMESFNVNSNNKYPDGGHLSEDGGSVNILSTKRSQMRNGIRGRKNLKRKRKSPLASLHSHSKDVTEEPKDMDVYQEVLEVESHSIVETIQKINDDFDLIHYACNDSDEKGEININKLLLNESYVYPEEAFESSSVNCLVNDVRPTLALNKAATSGNILKVKSFPNPEKCIQSPRNSLSYRNFLSSPTHTSPDERKEINSFKEKNSNIHEVRLQTDNTIIEENILKSSCPKYEGVKLPNLPSFKTNLPRCLEDELNCRIKVDVCCEVDKPDYNDSSSLKLGETGITLNPETQSQFINNGNDISQEEPIFDRNKQNAKFYKQIFGSQDTRFYRSTISESCAVTNKRFTRLSAGSEYVKTVVENLNNVLDGGVSNIKKVHDNTKDGLANQCPDLSLQHFLSANIGSMFPQEVCNMLSFAFKHEHSPTAGEVRKMSKAICRQQKLLQNWFIKARELCLSKKFGLRKTNLIFCSHCMVGVTSPAIEHLVSKSHLKNILGKFYIEDMSDEQKADFWIEEMRRLKLQNKKRRKEMEESQSRSETPVNECDEEEKHYVIDHSLPEGEQILYSKPDASKEVLSGTYKPKPRSKLISEYKEKLQLLKSLKPLYNKNYKSTVINDTSPYQKLMEEIIERFDYLYGTRVIKKDPKNSCVNEDVIFIDSIIRNSNSSSDVLDNGHSVEETSSAPNAPPVSEVDLEILTENLTQLDTLPRDVVGKHLYQCPHCLHIYSDKWKLVKHSLTHKLFNCTYCLNRYPNEETLHTHIMRHFEGDSSETRYSDLSRCKDCRKVICSCEQYRETVSSEQFKLDSVPYFLSELEVPVTDHISKIESLKFLVQDYHQYFAQAVNNRLGKKSLSLITKIFKKPIAKRLREKSTWNGIGKKPQPNKVRSISIPAVDTKHTSLRHFDEELVPVIEGDTKLCVICDETFASNLDLREHMFLHKTKARNRRSIETVEIDSPSNTESIDDADDQWEMDEPSPRPKPEKPKVQIRCFYCQRQLSTEKMMRVHMKLRCKLAPNRSIKELLKPNRTLMDLAREGYGKLYYWINTETDEIIDSIDMSDRNTYDAVPGSVGKLIPKCKFCGMNFERAREVRKHLQKTCHLISRVNKKKLREGATLEEIDAVEFSSSNDHFLEQINRRLVQKHEDDENMDGFSLSEAVGFECGQCKLNFATENLLNKHKLNCKSSLAERKVKYNAIINKVIGSLNEAKRKPSFSQDEDSEHKHRKMDVLGTTDPNSTTEIIITDNLAIREPIESMVISDVRSLSKTKSKENPESYSNSDALSNHLSPIKENGLNFSGFEENLMKTSETKAATLRRISTSSKEVANTSLEISINNNHSDEYTEEMNHVDGSTKVNDSGDAHNKNDNEVNLIVSNYTASVNIKETDNEIIENPENVAKFLNKSIFVNEKASPSLADTISNFPANEAESAMTSKTIVSSKRNDDSEAKDNLIENSKYTDKVPISELYKGGCCTNGGDVQELIALESDEVQSNDVKMDEVSSDTEEESDDGELLLDMDEGNFDNIFETVAISDENVIRK